MAAPGTIDVALLVKLPLLSTFHTMYWSSSPNLQATW